MCAGLAAAHERGVLHRDLKPANVMIDGRGQARLTDFGLAVDVQRQASSSDFAGTVPYMAPERLNGAPATVQSDVYALGLVLYETFTGRPAFRASSLEEWRHAHEHSTPARPSQLAGDVDAATERAILQCLEKEPGKRPSSARRVAASLPGGDPLAAALAAGETPSPELVAASGEEGTLSRRRAWGLGAACLASLAIAAGTWQMTSLAGIVPFEGSPDVLRAKARNILRDLGHDETARDHAWEITVDDQRLGYLTDAPGEAIGFAKVARAVPTPLAFHYRQSPSALRPVSVAGIVTADDPAPLVPGEAAVYLVISTRLGAALFDGVVVWLFYLGLEPFARRSWPHLLIGWTRFLDGRWRDPLVGQAVLAGVLFGTILPAVATLPEASGRLLGLAGEQRCTGRPRWPARDLTCRGGNMALAGLKNALALVAFMVVARFALRTPGAVLAATALVAATAAT